MFALPALGNSKAASMQQFTVLHQILVFLDGRGMHVSRMGEMIFK
jgi:hypothetical protein